MDNLESLIYTNLPVYIAKTQYSLSGYPRLHRKPDRFRITVRQLKVSANARYVVP